MEKSFKLQRIGFIIYLITLLIAAFFSLSFMTDYENLFGFYFPVNKGVIDFHLHMVDFNNVMFWFSVVGCISIIFMFVLELRTKICDWFALGVMTTFGTLNVASAIYGFIRMSNLIKEYKGVDFTHMWEEDKALEGVVYTLKFDTFYIGYAVLAILLVVTLAYIAILWINRIRYKKSEVLDHAQ